jgi:hypothetical protein
MLKSQEPDRVRPNVVVTKGIQVNDGLHMDGTGIMIRFTSASFFLLDQMGLRFKAFGHELWSDPNNTGTLILERPDGSSWRWSRRYGRWREDKDGNITDGWMG